MMSATRGSYQDQLIEVIDKYIQDVKKNNLDSAGVKRALLLKSAVNWRLTVVEKLTDRQLIWRMLDYAAMQRGIGPLETSTQLRLRILRDLCDCLMISDVSIKKESDLVRCQELKIAMSSPFPPGIFYFEDNDNVAKIAMVNLIKKCLKRIYSYDDQQSRDLVLHLAGVLNGYIEGESTKCFSEPNCSLARHALEVMRAEWVMHENLNEEQMLWRLYEQLTMPGMQGMFDFDLKLRGRMLAALCQFLHCNENQINADINNRIGHSYFQLSWFGPVFVPAIDDRVYHAVRCQHILTKLEERSPLLSNRNEMRTLSAH